MMPVCRAPGDASRCAGREDLAARGLAGCWAGLAALVAGPVKVGLWRDDSGIRMAGSPAGDPPIEEVACWLAEQSASPRYAGGNWIKLLQAEPNVTHAFRAALAREQVPAVTLGQWCDRLSRWHRGNNLARHELKHL